MFSRGVPQGHTRMRLPAPRGASEHVRMYSLLFCVIRLEWCLQFGMFPLVLTVLNGDYSYTVY